jgi:hypothetical protein
MRVRTPPRLTPAANFFWSDFKFGIRPHACCDVYHYANGHDYLRACGCQMALVGRVARVMRSLYKRVLALLKCALQHTLAGAIDTRRKKHRALSKKACGAELCYGVMSFIGRRCLFVVCFWLRRGQGDESNSTHVGNGNCRVVSTLTKCKKG